MFMPIYEFVCQCGQKEEQLVKMGTETIKCPTCGKDMKKVISLSTFHLMGHCWSVDGYDLKPEGKKGGNKSDG